MTGQRGIPLQCFQGEEWKLGRTQSTTLLQRLGQRFQTHLPLNNLASITFTDVFSRVLYTFNRVVEVLGLESGIVVATRAHNPWTASLFTRGRAVQRPIVVKKWWMKQPCGCSLLSVFLALLNRDVSIVVFVRWCWHLPESVNLTQNIWLLD